MLFPSNGFEVIATGGVVMNRRILVRLFGDYLHGDADRWLRAVRLPPS
jgi:hypothetical protein